MSPMRLTLTPLRGSRSPLIRARAPPCSRRGLQVVAFKSYSPLGAREGWDHEEGEVDLLLEVVCSYSLVFGTAAVALGGLLQVPALGSLHWNAPDALLGLQLAVPILLADLPLADFWPTGEDTDMLEDDEDEEEDEEEEELEDVIALHRAERSQGEQEARSMQHAAALAAQLERDSELGAQQLAVASAGLDAAAAGAESSCDNDEDYYDDEEEEEEEDVEAPHPAIAALQDLRESHTLQSISFALSWPGELGLILAHHLGEELLWRAVLLGGLAKLATAVLYGEGAAAAPMAAWDSLSAGGWEGGLGVPQAVAVGLGAFSVAWSAGAAYWREAGATKAFASLGGGDFITLGSASGPDSDEEGAAAEGAEGEAPPPEIVVLFDGLPEDDEERQAACTWLADYMQQERRWAGAIEALREGTATACLSAAFLLTGNLLAPYVCAVASDLAYTAYVRSRRDQAMEVVDYFENLVLQAVQAEEDERRERLARLGLGPPTNRRPDDRE